VVINGNVNLINILLKKRVKIDEKNMDGLTALDIG
jgi:hypothetical protein